MTVTPGGRGDSVFVGRRDKGPKEKAGQPRAQFVATVAAQLDEMQNGLFERAREFRTANTRRIDQKDEFYAFFTPKNEEKPEIHGGFALSHWNGSAEVEAQLKNDLQVTIRCIPLDAGDGPGTCPFSGQPSQRRVVFGKAY